MPPGNGQEAQEAQDSKSLVGAIEKEVEAPAKLEGRKAEPEPTKEPEKPNSESKQDNADKSGDGAIDTTLQDPTDRAAKLDASESHPKETMDASTRNAQNARITKPLETVLQMGAPTVENLDEHKTPHLQAPPYVHHFDTFTLVKDLERGGFTQDQSVTLMKAVRSLLAINLDVAREGLVSKSDVENACLPYLFPFFLIILPPISILSHSSSPLSSSYPPNPLPLTLPSPY